jgi:ABC-2 type transport system permease protein
MNIIFKITRNELRNLFYSPVAWFLAILFLIQCGYFYIAGLYPWANSQSLLLLNNPNWKTFGDSLTTAVFFSSDGIVVNAFKNLYLFIPLLTMGLLSREVTSGSIKLLYSSPIKLYEIVLGKYIAVVIFNLLLIGIFGIFVVSGLLHIQSLDISWLLTTSLGLYLLICTSAAIGLFMSSLTNYQIISAIGSFTILFILGRIGSLWQQYDFVRDLTYFLSVSGRTEKMIMGLITSRDVLYYLIIISMFLVFTVLKLKAEREARPWFARVGRYSGVLLLAVLLGYITSRPGFVLYWDTTATQKNTINVRTQKLLQKMEGEPMVVTLYANILGTRYAPGLPEARNSYLSGLWENYLRFKPDIKFRYVYYYDNDGRSYMRSLRTSYPGKTEKELAEIIARLRSVDVKPFLKTGPKEIRKMIDPYAEDLAMFLEVKYKGRKVHLRTFNDDLFWPDEMQIAGGLKRLVEGNVPKVYFLNDNLERSIRKQGEREFSVQAADKSSRKSLINLGFDVDSLSLEKQQAPDKNSILVIADPKTNFSPAVLSKLEKYTSRGGNMLIFGEPGKQAVLNPLLKSLGIQYRPGILVQPSENETPDKIISYFTEPAFNLAEEPKLAGVVKKRKMKNFEDIVFSMMPGATAISYTVNGPYQIQPLLQTLSQKSWLKTRHLVTDSVAPVFNAEEGDIRDSSFCTAVQLTRKVNQHEQRIIVAGDADFRSNQRFGTDEFGNAFYSWLNYGAYPIYLPGIAPKDLKVTITEPAAVFMKTIYVWVLPAVFLALGTLLLIRRKRK